MSAGQTNVSTRERLLGLLDDIELISKELLENVVAVKPKRLSHKEEEELTLLLISKDKELKEVLQLASEQADLEKQIQELQEEVNHQDDCIKQLQKQFKDAESLLSTAVYQARQKLESISKAKQTPVNSDDLIRYAHRISASNAVCAPLNWEQGDPRRPYPTDLEMRLGFLGRGDAAVTEAIAARGTAAKGHNGFQPPGGTTPSSNPDFHAIRAPSSPHVANPRGFGQLPAGVSPSRGASHQGLQTGANSQGGAPGQFAWQGGEMIMTYKDGTSVAIETNQGQGNEEVEVMSTDSSSSSSTDSN